MNHIAALNIFLVLVVSLMKTTFGRNM